MGKFRSISIIYIIGLHILCGIILVKSDFIDKVGLRFGLISPPEISKYYNRITTYHERMDGSIPEGSTIFIGDSITQSLATSAISDLSANYGIGSDTTAGVIKRLPLYKSIRTAKAFVVAIGVNDLSRRDNREIVDNFKRILTFFPKGKRIVVSAILPVGKKINSDLVSNERIIKLNSDLKLLTSNYQNVGFIDARAALENIDGDLKPEFHIGDGVHLSAAGYKVWINLLSEALSNA